jgi:hypothetical protein
MPQCCGIEFGWHQESGGFAIGCRRLQDVCAHGCNCIARIGVREDGLTACDSISSSLHLAVNHIEYTSRASQKSNALFPQVLQVLDQRRDVLRVICEA